MKCNVIRGRGRGAALKISHVVVIWLLTSHLYGAGPKHAGLCQTRLIWSMGRVLAFSHDVGPDNFCMCKSPVLHVVFVLLVRKQLITPHSLHVLCTY